MEIQHCTLLKESSRTPSVAELGCADPDQPCRLPNSFQADPPLDQVKNRSIEFGARGDKNYNLMGMDHNINWKPQLLLEEITMI